MRVGLVCATTFELPEKVPSPLERQVRVTVINGSYLATAVSGVGAENAAASTAVLCEDFNLDYVLTLGLCGGAKPGMKPGHLVLANEAWYGRKRIVIQSKWGMAALEAIVCSGIPYHIGSFQMFDEAVLSMGVVLQGASAVDVESYAIAAEAGKHGVPVVIVKAVSDVIPRQELPNQGARLAAEIEQNFPVAKRSLDVFFGRYFGV